MTHPLNRPFRVVVGVDGSEISESVIERALDAAHRHDSAEMHFIRVVDISPTVFHRGHQGQIDAAHSQLHTAVSEKLDDFGFGDQHGYRARVYATAGKAAEEILQLAADVEADLIVIGRHGHEGTKSKKFGTVPQQVIRDARCPVLVEQPPEYVAQEPACEACVAARRDSDGERWFCDAHSAEPRWKSTMVITSAFIPVHGVS